MILANQPFLIPNYCSPKVNTLPMRERPDYRLDVNPDACNLMELLSVLISGKQQIEKAQALIERFGSIQLLAQAHIDEIAKVDGIGRSTALRIKAAIMLGRKVLDHQDIQPSIVCPDDAYQILRPTLANLMHEVLVVMVLNTKSNVIRTENLYHGTVNSSPVRCAEVFRTAIQVNGVGIIIAHNHPSGDPTPSTEDIRLTRALIASGAVLEMELMDHLVIGQGRYVSMKREKLGF